MDAETILKREDNLLRWETYLRRTRAAACVVGIVGLLGLAYWLMVDRRPDFWNAPAIWQAVIVLLLAYETHLKVLHIESIKYHRSKTTP
jgi:hypothetical protein